MYVNFWYPMAQADELKDAPLKVLALGTEFVLFRDADNNAVCLADTCIHRGGSLASGKIRDHCIECPYHGWRYGSDGVCRHIPTLAEESRIPARARVDAYPVDERYGLIFAFLGDLPAEKRPPILDIPEWGQDGWSTTSFAYDWDANVERAIENALDATHTEFVHGSLDMAGQFKPGNDLETIFEDTEWGSACIMKTPRLEIVHGHHGLSHHWTYLEFALGKQTGHSRFYSFVRPIDEHSVRRYLFHTRNFQLGEEMDKQMTETTWGFEGEDRRVVEEMKPAYSPRTSHNELLMPEDEIMVRYRNWLNEWESNGWRIDSNRVRHERNEKAFSIPCPDRAESKNWVLDAIPLMPAGRREVHKKA